MNQRNRKHKLLTRMRAAKRKHVYFTWTEKYPKSWVNAVSTFFDAWYEHHFGGVVDKHPNTPKAIKFAHRNYVRLNGRFTVPRVKVRTIKKHAERYYERRYARYEKKHPRIYESKTILVAQVDHSTKLISAGTILPTVYLN